MTARRGVLSLLGAAAAFAVAFRHAGRRRDEALQRLKPGRREQDERTAPDVALGPAALGRDAEAPQHIPPRGWWQIAKRTALNFSKNELMSEAASVTFYGLLSLFPAVTAVVSIYGLFADRSMINAQLGAIVAFVPSGGMQIITDQVHRLTQSPAGGLSVGAVAGVLIALWSANAGTKAMFSALNDVYGETEKRGFVKVTAISLAFTFGGILVLLAGMGLIVALPLAFRWLGWGGALDTSAQALRWPILLLVIISALAALFRFGPSRRLARWRWVTWGSTIGAIGWIVLSLGFSWYVANFGSYNKTYGSLGAVVGFMTWMWLSATVLLVGAQINAEIEAQTARDSTVGPAKPLGSRGASSADVVS